MAGIWSNPEFVRQRRAELRPGRAMTAAAVVVLMCILLGLGHAGVRSRISRGTCNAPRRSMERRHGLSGWMFSNRILRATHGCFFRWLVGLQGVALTFWALFSCAQSVSGERDRKTWDFQRTTRLTAAELTGKLLGEPVLVYFAVLCAAPATVISGLAAGLSIGTVFSILIFLAVVSLFLGLGGMWLSTLLESRSRGVGLIAALALYGFTLGLFGCTPVACPDWPP